MKQTAVEWLIEQLEEKGELRETASINNIQLNIDTSDYLDLKRQAKEMEKEQKGYSYEDMEKCWDASKRFGKPISEGYAPNFNEFIEQFKKKL